MNPHNNCTKPPRQRKRFVLTVVGWLSLSIFASTVDLWAQEAVPSRGAMVSARDATAERLGELKAAGINAVAIPIHNDKAARQEEQKAFARIQQAGLSVGFWVEVARCPELAHAHPAYMASLQGHPEWRRLFKNTPSPGEGEVAKTYPWVPILNKEPFAAQLTRITTLLQDRASPDTVFLNDIQGAPSACGCGHHLCRWTSDYGKLRTTTPLGPQAPADFVTAVQQLMPKVEVVPVWATECEEHDGTAEGLCAGVGCFQGICWKAWTQQLLPVARQCQTVGVLLPYKAFQRDQPIYGPEAGWIMHAVTSFQTMPRRYGTTIVEPSQLLTVLQGWDVTDAQIANQIEMANAAGVQRTLIAYQQIDQSWTPRITKVR